jgi:hypothetical protein
MVESGDLWSKEAGKLPGPCIARVPAQFRTNLLQTEVNLPFVERVVVRAAMRSHEWRVTRRHAPDTQRLNNRTVWFTWVVDMMISTGQLLSNGSSEWKVVDASADCLAPKLFLVTLAPRIGPDWGQSFVLTFDQFRVFVLLNGIRMHAACHLPVDRAGLTTFDRAGPTLYQPPNERGTDHDSLSL